MRWKETAVSERLNIKYPIIQGPFGGGASSLDLTVTVSEGGGLGSFGANHLTGAEITEIIQQIRRKTTQPFAINLWIPFAQSDDAHLSEDVFNATCQLLKPYFNELNLPLPAKPERLWPSFSEQIEALLAAQPPVFSFVFGVPSDDILERCKALDIVTIGTATSPAEAMLLDKAGVDLIVASGFEAGGHRTSFLAPAEKSLFGTFALIPQVVDAVETPVIAAGGIADGRGIAAALELGAQGVQIGTAFLACDESNANKLHRQALWDPNKALTQLTRVFSGRLARGIENRFMLDLKACQNIAPYPMQNWFTNQLKLAAIKQNRADLISLWCGQSAPLLKHRSAKVLLDALVDETDEVLSMLSQ